MKVCFLITGIPRRFFKYLYLYLQSLESFLDYDVYLYFPKENCDENYANEIIHPSSLSSLLQNSRYKLILLDSVEPVLPETLSRKQKNCVLQWYRIQKCFSMIPSSSYDRIVRVRPDIEFLIDPKQFAEIVASSPEDQILIPEGYEKESQLNDQFACGSYAKMKEYCSLFHSIEINEHFASDTLLSTYMERSKISLQRIHLPYKLALSDCKVIAIAGDSASGKSTLLQYLQDILPTDSSLCIETDSYHKWERGHENWNQYTHLHPDANHLERMSEDVLRLKIGSNVAMVEYDHATGKFTQEKLTKGKPFLLLCGLHTLYKKTILNELDIKIFLDTHESLKLDWKLKRDTEERHHSIDKVLESISKRKKDSETFILPQKQHANCIIEYKIEENLLVVNVHLTPVLSSIVHPFADFFSSSVTSLENGFFCYRLQEEKTSSQIKTYIDHLESKVLYIPQHPFQDGTTGILQLLVFLLLFYENEQQ